MDTIVVSPGIGQPVLTPGEGVTLIQNNDSSTIIYLCNSASMTIGDPSVIPLPPKAWLVLQGDIEDEPVFANTQASRATLYKIPGGMSFFQSIVPVITGPGQVKAVLFGPTGADDGAALLSLISQGYNDIRLLPGIYNSQTEVSYTSSGSNPISITAPWGCVTWFSTAMPAWRWHGSVQSSSPFGELSGIIFDGTHAGVVVSGVPLVDVGDLTNAKIDIVVQNMSGSNTNIHAGLRIGNDSFQTEYCDISCESRACYTGISLERSGTGTASFKGTKFKFKIIQSVATYNGVVIGGIQGTQGDMRPYDGTMEIISNFVGSTSSLAGLNPYTTAANNPAVLTMTNGSFFEGQIHFGCEMNQPGGGGAIDKAATIVMDTPGTEWINARGYMKWDAGNMAFTSSNLQIGAGSTLSPHALQFEGQIAGDTTLCVYSPASKTDLQLVDIGLRQQTMGSFESGGIVHLNGGRNFARQLTANMTISLSGLSGTIPGGSWCADISIQQGVAGGFTVSWPGSITWISGSAPIMPAAANSWLLVRLRAVIMGGVQVILGAVN